MRAATEAKAERAYQMRKRTGCSWEVIARAVGYSRIGAWTTARRWAMKHKKKWPPAPYLSTGRICYDLASNEKMKWEDIAEELGKSKRQVFSSAFCHAQTHGLFWPRLGRFSEY
tara:strand:+ start:2503 stop:2844 length:342 start_codon:yes stop_codon:yes gene_type:complete